jgi:DNA-binding beta-propeller fold protein YncE
MSTSVMAYQLERVDEWPQVPEGVEIVEAPGVAVNSADRVYVLTRNPEHPILVFEADGTFVISFGAGIFTNRAHGISIGPDDCVYCADDGTHTVTKFTPDGQLLMTLGTPGEPAPRWSGAPFNRPTHATPSPTTGDLFITDGYGNARVHRYTAQGEHVLSWGESGSDTGQFIIPHDVVVDDRDRVYVADRECNRIQVFEPDGTFLTEFSDVHRPDGITLGPDGHLWVAELGPAVSVISDAPGVGRRLSVLTLSGELLGRYGDPMAGEGPGQFTAPHGIAVDSAGAVYVSEVSWTIRGQYLDPPRRLRSLSKMVPV